MHNQKKMSKKETLETLEKEIEYYRTEFNSKMAENKTSEVLSVINEFKTFFEKDECDLSQKTNGELNVKKHSKICKVTPDFDYSENHKSARQFSIKINKNADTLCDLKIRLFLDESELPKPDLNRLKTNPYQGMDTQDIEILEQKKNIDYFKEYIKTDESNKWNFVCLDNLKSSQEMFDTLIELYKEKVHNTIYSK